MRAILGVALALLTAVVPLISALDTGMDPALQALPKCAVACLSETIARSACATNQTAACICADGYLQNQMMVCVRAHCAMKQALATKNTTDKECGFPRRDRGPAYNIAATVLAVMSCIIALVRLGFKLLATRGLSSDDYVVFILVLAAVPSVVIMHSGTTANGVGRDIWTLTPQNITNFLFYFYVAAILYCIQVMLVKLCLLLFYLRIFPGETVRRLLWGTVSFAVLFGVVFFFFAIFQCSPISHFWQYWDGEHEGKCLDLNAIAWAHAGISIALDVWMLAIPLAQLNTLSLHWKKKVGGGIMFCVGTFVTVVSIIRLQALVALGKSSNPTWDYVLVSLWSAVEIYVGIICTCMPTLRLLLVRLFPTLGSSSYAKGSYPSGGGQVLSSKVRNNQGRTLNDLTSISKPSGAQPRSSSDTVSTRPLGIIREQTFAVQDDGDETSLVQMRGLTHSGRSHASDTLK